MSELQVPVLPRSFLYVPGNREALFPKAAAGPADAVVLDLEDAVPLGEKDTARRLVGEWLHASADNHREGPQWWARVNAGTVSQDLEAVTRPGLQGVLLAECSSSGLEEVAEALERLEAGRGLEPGSVQVIGLVETAAALAGLHEVVRSRRLTTLGIGEVDLLADLRMHRTERSAAALDGLRSQVVLQCAAAGLAAPVAPTSTAYRDLNAFTEGTRHLHDLGFRSRTAIHPAQVPVIHEVLTPDEDTVATASDVVARFEAAAGGVTTDEHGRLIDAAVVREAREVLARAHPSSR